MKKIRPLTKTMMAKLSHCRQMELEDKYCLPEDIKYCLAPLYKRGFIGLKKTVIHGKELMAVFITPEGIQYLDYFTSRNKLSAH